MEGYVLLLQRGRRGQPSRDVAAAAAWAACNALIRGYQVKKREARNWRPDARCQRGAPSRTQRDACGRQRLVTVHTHVPVRPEQKQRLGVTRGCQGRQLVLVLACRLPLMDGVVCQKWSLGAALILQKQACE